MDLTQRPEGSEDDGSPYPMKTIVIGLAIGKFVVETLINYRQLQLLRRWTIPSDEESRLWAVKRIRYTIFSSFCSMVQIATLIGLDAVPALWRFVVEMEDKLLKLTEQSPLCISHDYDRSIMFMICCFVAFILINIPTYLYRTFVLHERVIRNFYSLKNQHRIAYNVANGYPVNAALCLVYFWILQFKAHGLSDRYFSLCVLSSQLLYVILYPVVTQPRRKTLSIMETGEMQHAIEELSAAAKFPLKDIYVIDDQFTTDVRIFGLPQRKHIAIPKTIMEEFNVDDITGFVAHAMGAWKHATGFCIFVVGQLYFYIPCLYVEAFTSERTNYKAFGFEEEFPRMAAFVLFTISFEPTLSAVLGLLVNHSRHLHSFVADKYAVNLGFASALDGALIKRQSTERSGDVDAVYSIYYNRCPTLSQRLKNLEKLQEEKASKDEGLVPSTEEEKR